MSVAGGIIHLPHTQNFPKNCFSPPDKDTYMCVSGGQKHYFSGKVYLRTKRIIPSSVPFKKSKTENRSLSTASKEIWKWWILSPTYLPTRENLNVGELQRSDIKTWFTLLSHTCCHNYWKIPFKRLQNLN